MKWLCVHRECFLRRRCVYCQIGQPPNAIQSENYLPLERVSFTEHEGDWTRHFCYGSTRTCRRPS